MREQHHRRLIVALLFAAAAGAIVYFDNPADHLKADLRADAEGFVLSLEYGVHAVNTATTPSKLGLVR